MTASLKNQMGETAHQRSISITTHTCGDQAIIVAGELIDNRLKPTYDFQGQQKPPQTVHHMIVRFRVEIPSLTISEVETEMPGIPREQCAETRDSLEQVRGIRLVQGFTVKIKEMYAKGQGCAHLVELLLAMAPAAIQGLWSAVSSRPVPSEAAGMMEKFLTDTCWVWRKDGPAIQQLIAETRNLAEQA
jgi:hypothetical protein